MVNRSSVFVLVSLLALPAAASTVASQQAMPIQMLTDLRILTQSARASAWVPGAATTVLRDLQGTAGNPRSGPNPPLFPPPDVYEAPVPPPILNVAFNGIPSTGVFPSGVSGDVGIDHYLQVVNDAFAFYSKTGDLVAGPISTRALWPATAPCGTVTGGGDQARYDHFAKRWVISRYADPPNASPRLCVAVSRTADPITGGWNLYDFTTDGVYPGAPKLALSVNGYAMATFRGTVDAGSDVWMFERTKMLAGIPAQLVHVAVAEPVPFLPGDIEPITTGPGGPFTWDTFGNLFFRFIDGERFGGKDRLELYLFDVYWTSPTASRFYLRKSIEVAPFDSIVCSLALMDQCVPQPGTTVKLGSLSAFATGRAQRLLRSKAEKVLLTQTINVNGRAAVRWYDVQRTWTIPQDWIVHDWGVHADDSLWRWNGSVAMDNRDDIAFGFHAASETVYASLRIGARRQGQPWATVTRETTLVQGGGAQTERPRFGGASSVELDPQNDCTFWFTGEYYDTTSAAGWKTRIMSFTHPNCRASAQGSFVVTNLPEGGFGAWASTIGARSYVADFDGDHKDDILLLGPPSWNTAPIAFATGSGAFRFVNLPSSLAASAAATNARALIGDVNGDGKADVVITGGSGSTKIVVGLSKGDGTFTVVEYPHANFAFWASRGNPLMGDFNGDGKADVLVVGPGWGTIPVAFSKGDGTFNVTNASVDTFTMAAAARGARAFVGDFDGDGRDDVALTGVSAWTTLPVAFSNGDGTFAVTNVTVLQAWFNGVLTSFPSWAAQSNARIFVGRQRGNRKAYLLATGPSTLKGAMLCMPDSQVRGQFLTYPTGNMAEPFGTYSSLGAVKTLAADFSGDGVLDLALVGLSALNTIPTAFGQSTSFFVANAALPRFQTWSANALPVTGDFDGNGLQDIALVGAAGATTLPVAFSITP